MAGCRPPDGLKGLYLNDNAFALEARITKTAFGQHFLGAAHTLWPSLNSYHLVSVEQAGHLSLIVLDQIGIVRQGKHGPQIFLSDIVRIAAMILHEP